MYFSIQTNWYPTLLNIASCSLLKVRTWVGTACLFRLIIWRQLITAWWNSSDVISLFVHICSSLHVITPLVKLRVLYGVIVMGMLLSVFNVWRVFDCSSLWHLSSRNLFDKVVTLFSFPAIMSLIYNHKCNNSKIFVLKSQPVDPLKFSRYFQWRNVYNTNWYLWNHLQHFCTLWETVTSTEFIQMNVTHPFTYNSIHLCGITKYTKDDDLSLKLAYSRLVLTFITISITIAKSTNNCKNWHQEQNCLI